MSPEARRGVRQASWMCSPHSKCAVIFETGTMKTSLTEFQLNMARVSGSIY